MGTKPSNTQKETKMPAPPAKNPAPTATPAPATPEATATPTPQPEKAKAARAATPSDQKTFGVTLSDGANVQMRLIGTRRGNGTYRVYAQQVTLDENKHVKESKRGATQDCANYVEAQAAMTKLSDALQAKGWLKRNGGFGGGAVAVRKDDFDLSNLPAPAGK